MSDRRLTDEHVETMEAIAGMIPAEFAPPGDPVLESGELGECETADRQGYGTPAPSVGITEASFAAAKVIASGDAQKKPENDLVWVAQHLGYPPAMNAQKSPEAPYGNPGKGV